MESGQAERGYLLDLRREAWSLKPSDRSQTSQDSGVSASNVAAFHSMTGMEQRHTNAKDMNSETNLRQEKLQELEWCTRDLCVTLSCVVSASDAA